MVGNAVRHEACELLCPLALLVDPVLQGETLGTPQDCIL